jgi:hypothetical protein
MIGPRAREVKCGVASVLEIRELAALERTVR